MSRIKASAMALLIAIPLFVNAYKPSDHEQVSESPTVEQTPLMDIDANVTGTDTAEVTQTPTAQPKVYEYEATFYTARCEGCSGITASGEDVRNTTHVDGYRVLAADRSIPFGTTMRITLEDGTVFDGIVQDRGGAIRGNKLDILVESKTEAYRLGRQQVKVEIIE